MQTNRENFVAPEPEDRLYGKHSQSNNRWVEGNIYTSKPDYSLAWETVVGSVIYDERPKWPDAFWDRAMDIENDVTDVLRPLSTGQYTVQTELSHVQNAVIVFGDFVELHAEAGIPVHDNITQAQQILTARLQYLQQNKPQPPSLDF